MTLFLSCRSLLCFSRDFCRSRIETKVSLNICNYCIFDNDHVHDFMVPTILIIGQAPCHQSISQKKEFCLNKGKPLRLKLNTLCCEILNNSSTCSINIVYEIAANFARIEGLLDAIRFSVRPCLILVTTHFPQNRSFNVLCTFQTLLFVLFVSSPFEMAQKQNTEDNKCLEQPSATNFSVRLIVQYSLRHPIAQASDQYIFY